MLIYLDANIVQYCADYEDFIFGDGALPSGTKARLRRELSALRTLGEIELQLEHLDFDAVAQNQPCEEKGVSWEQTSLL